MADVRLRDLNPAEFNYGVNVAGNLGVGTTSPNAKVEIVSDGSDSAGAEIRLQHANNNSTDIVSTVNFANNVGSVAMIQAGTTSGNTNGYISFHTDSGGTSTEKMRINANGYVGIGTAGSYNGLHIKPASGNGQLVVEKASGASCSINSQTSLVQIGTISNHPLQLTANSTAYVHITTAGNVGIGETDPAYQLDVNSGSTGTVAQFKSTSTTAKIMFNNSGSNACFLGSQNNNLFFQTNSTNRMFITTAGNVGIATTNPTDGDLSINAPKLHVVGPSTASAYHLVARFQAGSDADNTGASILINHSNDRGLLIEAGRASSDRGIAHFGIITSAGVNRRTLTLHDDGGTPLVGIGTDTPEETLHVNGNLKVTGTVDVGSSGFSVSSGFILPFGGGTAPSGWLQCDGAAVSRSTYSDLFAIIGTIYGAGDGSTTFNLPDLQGRVIMGQGGSVALRTPSDLENIGDTFGSQTHTLTVNEMPSHSHSYSFRMGLESGRSGSDPKGTEIDEYERTFKGNTNKTGGEGAHNNIQPSIVINYLIKT
jgi:microcystin-dependent protein